MNTEMRSDYSISTVPRAMRDAMRVQIARYAVRHGLDASEGRELMDILGVLVSSMLPFDDRDEKGPQ